VENKEKQGSFKTMFFFFTEEHSFDEHFGSYSYCSKTGPRFAFDQVAQCLVLSKYELN